MKYLTKKVVVTLTICTLIITVLIATYFFVNYQSNSYADQYRKIDNEVKKLESSLAKTNRLLKELEEIYDVWKKIPPQKKLIKDFKIGSVNKILDIGGERFNIKNIKISFAKDSTDTDIIRLVSKVNLRQYSIQIDFDTILEEDGYRFIHYIKESFPGYIKLLSAKIVNKEDISPATLKKINNGDYVSLTNVNISFIWYYLEEKQQQ